MERRERYSITQPAGNCVTRELTGREAADLQLNGAVLRKLGGGDQGGYRGLHYGDMAKRLAQLEAYFRLDGKCGKCQEKLKSGDYRVVFMILQLWGDSVMPRSLRTLCGPCATTVPNFDVHNSLYIPTVAEIEASIPPEVRDQEALEGQEAARAETEFVAEIAASTEAALGSELGEKRRKLIAEIAANADHDPRERESLRGRLAVIDAQLAAPLEKLHREVGNEDLDYAVSAGVTKMKREGGESIRAQQSLEQIDENTGGRVPIGKKGAERERARSAEMLSDGDDRGNFTEALAAKNGEGWVVERPRKEDHRRLIRTFLLSPYANKLRAINRKVATLFCEGRTQAEIAKIRGISQANVSKMIRAIKAEAEKAEREHRR